MNARLSQYDRVPVLMFHSIGMKSLPWVWSNLSEDASDFEQILAGLDRYGYTSVSLAELYAYMSGRAGLPEKPVVLTFDDGYLDNWVVAAPLLRKYGMRGTVYVSPDFVDPDDNVRLPDSFDTSRPSELAGFMSWPELKAADEEGILDVQSHALTHTWVFNGPKVIDIHRPKRVHPYPWLSWNARPERKPYYLTEAQQDFVAWGQPILENDKALVARRFSPDLAFVESVTSFVGLDGGAEFFEEPAWQQRLHGKFPQLAGDGGVPGTYESDDEYRDRVRHELVTAKQVIEARLEKQVEFLAWPAGGVNDVAADIARNAGYRSWTLSSWQSPAFRNVPGANPEGIKRVSGHTAAFHNGRHLADGGAGWVLNRMRAHQGFVVSRLATAAKKTGWLLRDAMRLRGSR